MRRSYEAMPEGVWLVFDHEDTEPMSDGAVYDFSVWRYDPHLNLIDQLLVSWAGVPRPSEPSVSESVWNVDHVEGWNPARYNWVRLTDTQLAQLTMAAQHGVFRRVAKAMWERIMA